MRSHFKLSVLRRFKKGAKPLSSTPSRPLHSTTSPRLPSTPRPSPWCHSVAAAAPLIVDPIAPLRRRKFHANVLHQWPQWAKCGWGRALAATAPTPHQLLMPMPTGHEPGRRHVTSIPVAQRHLCHNCFVSCLRLLAIPTNGFMQLTAPAESPFGLSRP
jgi:hypothetical protein